ncbi:MAG: helix-turn-helix domain-containing protein [Proteobacteria bacterium]|nr:helix-turn-helix domain-containing protein [Pseudomonadota bacterium]
MNLLAVLAQRPEPIGPKQISQLTGLQPSTAHRILSTMTADRIVDRVEPGAYRFGMRLLQLGNKVKSRINVRQRTLPVMRELHAQTSETVNLSVGASRRRDRIRGTHLVGPLVDARGARGRHAPPLHITAAGKLFLLEEGFPRLRELARRTGLKPHTKATLSTLPQLERKLERIQRQG